MRLRILNPLSDVEILQTCIESAPRYWNYISGEEPDLDTAKSIFEALPPGKSIQSKRVLGIFLSHQNTEEMVGCVDLIRGYPSEFTAMLGLLLIREKYQKQGCGFRSVMLIQQWIRQEWPEITTLRIGVVDSNPVLVFWEKMGFQLTGEFKPYADKKVISQTRLLQKKL